MSAVRCRCTEARDTSRAAQTAVVRPLPGVKATTAAIPICRGTRTPAPSRPAALSLFLEDDDCFRLIEAAAQGGILPIGLGQFGLQRVRRNLFRTAHAGLKCTQSAGFTLTTPVAQG